MILDTMTYSAMTIVALTSFVVILLASLDQDQQAVSSSK